ncbi:efflux RND transporter permease subunit [Rhodovibrionaceae bacterium A322]
MNAIIDAAIAHSRTVLSTLVLILVAGTLSYISIPKESDPDINIPIVYVSLHQDGISPIDSERLLVKPVEKELSSIEGVKEMRSSAYLGGGYVLMEFDAGFDIDKAMNDVRKQVDIAKAELPSDADEPTVNEVNLSLFPVLTVTLAGDVPERTLLSIAKRLKDQIETVPTVLEAKIGGDREELVEMVVDPLMLDSYSLDPREIAQAVSYSNQIVAAGEMDTGNGRFPIKVPGLFESPEDILNMPLKVNGDAVVRFRDVGLLRVTYKDPTSFVRINGRTGITLEISKRTGTNIIATIDMVKRTVLAAQKSWPSDVEVTFNQDKSTDIASMLQDLQNNVISAILLVMIVVVAALGLRSAGLVGVAIPGSFLAGILIISIAGLTVNVVVLFSLILAVGMLVDGAIVVTEYADRKMTEGLDKREAYALAGKRMAWPIIASTATTLAAFLPLLFWPGTVGEFMKYLPITLIAVLSASLFMALIFVPTLGSVFGKSGGMVNTEEMQALSAADHGDFSKVNGFTRGYLKVLGTALNHPAKVVLMAVVVLIGVQVAYGKFGKGVEFFPSVDPENIQLFVHGRGNLSIEERDDLLREVESEVLNLQAEKGEFHSIYSRSLTSSGTSNDDEPEGLVGIITLEFVDWAARRPAEQIITDIRNRTDYLAGILVEPREEEFGPPVGKPVQIQVGSDDPDLIEPAVQKILGGLNEIGGFIDIEDGKPIPGIEWELRIDRAQAAKFGADVALIGQYVRMITNGMKLGEYRPDTSDEEVDLVVRLPEQYRTTQQLDRFRVQTSYGQVPISNFVTITPIPKTSLLRRVDRQRVMTVKANVVPGILPDDKVQEVRAWMEQQTFNPAVEIAFKGEDEEQKAASAFLGKAFAVALFMMAIILVTQFNSFYSAFLILTAVIMSTIGVMIGLMVTNQAFSIIMSGIGVIALAGIVVNNNIVLIDTFDRLKEETNSVRNAILLTGAQRLRPVMLTTITTMLGLLPMVLQMNIDFVARTIQIGGPSTERWVQLATAIVFGMGFATILTLVVTPSALMIRENVKVWRDGRRARKLAKKSGGTDGDKDAGPDLPNGVTSPAE